MNIKHLIIGASLLVIFGGWINKAPKVLEASEFVLRDQNGILRGCFAIRPEGSPGIALFDPAGQVRISVDLGNDGTTGFNVYDQKGILRGALALRPDGEAGLGFFDKNGQVKASLEAQPDLK